MFFLDFLWWSDCYIFSIWHAFIIVTDILLNETLLFEYLFYLYFTHFKKLPSLILNFLNFFGGNRTPTHPLKILKNVPVITAYNFEKQNNGKLSCQFSP